MADNRFVNCACIVYNSIVSLIDSLQKPDLFDHPVLQFEVLETHISWVLLTGYYAYKIKKPVNFGFIDFSTLEKRRHFCHEEIRLNRRLAPQIYIDVVSITGTPDQPELDTGSPAIEYAVRMKQFAQDSLLPNILATRGIEPERMDELANTVAGFHARVDIVPDASPYGNLEHISQPVLENFKQIRANLDCTQIANTLNALETWSKQQLRTLEAFFVQRKQQGYIRECHGDMHLHNMALVDDKIVIFDCIEFNKNFYLIDVMSEIAFLVMDLEDRQEPQLAQRFLNQYLEHTGDYTGLALLNFYKVYRAMVRAKVDALRASQEKSSTPEYQKTWQDFVGYLGLAERYIKPARPCLLINHGLSGSGKSVISKKIAAQLPAIVIRSDLERKRIHGIDVTQHDIHAVDDGLYTREATEHTYQHLVTQARGLLQCGYTVIIDAANLKHAQRSLFINLAQTLSCPVIVLHFQASEAVLRQRINRRLQDGHDASDATLEVLDHQIKSAEPLDDEETSFSITIDSQHEPDIHAIVLAIRKMMHDQASTCLT